MLCIIVWSALFLITICAIIVEKVKDGKARRKENEWKSKMMKNRH